MLNSNTLDSKDSANMYSSAREPKASPRAKKFDKHAGRKLVNTIPNSQLVTKKEGSKMKPKSTDNASIEELDQMLEDDALVLLNMKKDITNAQKEELQKLKDTVLSLKKEYDTIYVSNNLKERTLKSIKDKEITLQKVEEASYSNSALVQNETHDLTEQAEFVLDEFAAEERTIKMQNLMIKRLESEISQCRVDTARAMISVEHAKHDVCITENNLQNNRQELSDQEVQLEKLSTTLKARKDQRDKKLGVLHNLSLDGENSVARLQQSLAESSRRSELSEKIRMQQSTSRNASRGVGGHNNHNTSVEADEEEFADLIDPTGHRTLTISQVQEVVSRYNSQTTRIVRLKQLNAELRANIALQQKKKHEFAEHLAHTVFRIQQLASSRQIYQEVDAKDFRLTTTIKTCDSCKERDFRLRLSIEALKQSIPRFLTKVTKVVHPDPTENQLPDAILKLEDELTKLIKTIGSALLKDATPEDLALMSQQSSALSSSTTTAGNNSNSGSGGGNSGDASSEFSRLQRLPGYSRLQRQLFFNLMTARPDISNQNIRIDHIGKRVKQPLSTIGPAAHYIEPTPPPRNNNNNKPAQQQQGNNDRRGAGGHKNNNNNSNNSNGGNNNNNGSDEMTSSDSEPALDRATIKNISRLIYERDHGKLKTAGSTISS